MDPSDHAPPPDGESTERRAGLSRSSMALFVHYAFVSACALIFLISLAWLVGLGAALARGQAAAGVLVTAPVPVLGAIGALCGLEAGLGAVRASIRRFNRRRAA